MSKKKQPAATAPPKPAAVAYGSETFCSRCSGMVNHNGCTQDGCPVVSANAKAKADHG